MTSFDRLENLMSSALEKATIERLKPVSQALLPILPDVIGGLRDVITDPTSTPTQRMRALEMVMAAWSRCIRSEVQLTKAEHARNRHRLATAQAATERAKAKAAERAAKVYEAKEQKRIARILKKHERGL
jgi:hypothetical protein